jgi:ficolin
MAVYMYKLNVDIDVYYDQTTDEGGWTVFQNKINGEENFIRDWNDYKKGFGDLNGEFGLGMIV